MNPFLVDLARATDTERLRQARLTRPGRRLRAGSRTRPALPNLQEKY